MHKVVHPGGVYDNLEQFKDMTRVATMISVQAPSRTAEVQTAVMGQWEQLFDLGYLKRNGIEIFTRSRTRLTKRIITENDVYFEEH